MNFSSRSASSSSSSVVAALSVLSFSASNSTSSISSSVSYGDVNEPNSTGSSEIDACKKEENILQHESQIDSEPDKISEILAPYRNKSFYGKEWFYPRLFDYLINKKLLGSFSSSKSTSSGLCRYSHQILASASSVSVSGASCLVLIGDPGIGKTHLCCEMKWPTARADVPQLDFISQQIASVYFFDWLNSQQNHLGQFFAHLSASIQRLVLNGSIFNSTQKTLFKKIVKLDIKDFIEESSDDESDVEKLSLEFIENVLKPLKNLELKSNEETEAKVISNYFVLIDGIDDLSLQSQRLGRKMAAEKILLFINKIFPFFPGWLNLIITARRCTEKKWLRNMLTNLKYEKLAIDRCVNMGGRTMRGPCETSISPSIRESIEKKQTLPPSRSSHSLSNNNRRLSNSLEVSNAAHFANLKDIQTYILKRLDNEPVLKRKLDKQSAVEMLNMLLIKSNFCVLYVEKVLDLILADLVASSEIKDIPVTLNGLYLFLVERALHRTDKEILYSVISLSLAQLKPIDKYSLFSKVFQLFYSKFMQDLKKLLCFYIEVFIDFEIFICDKLDENTFKYFVGLRQVPVS